MKEIHKKYNCGNCDFFVFDAALQPTNANVIKTADADLNRKVRCGRCHKDPPQMVMLAVPNPLDARQVQMKQERVYPLMADYEFCSHHPMLRADTLRGLVAACFYAWDNRLTYKPGEIPDSIAAGFSRPPTLDEAKKLAFGADAKPGEAVPEPRK